MALETTPGSFSNKRTLVNVLLWAIIFLFQTSANRAVLSLFGLISQPMAGFAMEKNQPPTEIYDTPTEPTQFDWFRLVNSIFRSSLLTPNVDRSLLMIEAIIDRFAIFAI